MGGPKDRRGTGGRHRSGRGWCCCRCRRRRRRRLSSSNATTHGLEQCQESRQGPSTVGIRRPRIFGRLLGTSTRSKGHLLHLCIVHWVRVLGWIRRILGSHFVVDVVIHQLRALTRHLRRLLHTVFPSGDNKLLPLLRRNPEQFGSPPRDTAFHLSKSLLVFPNLLITSIPLQSSLPLSRCHTATMLHLRIPRLLRRILRTRGIVLRLLGKHFHHLQLVSRCPRHLATRFLCRANPNHLIHSDTRGSSVELGTLRSALLLLSKLLPPSCDLRIHLPSLQCLPS